MPRKAKPYVFTWPWTARQVENLDDCIGEIYRKAGTQVELDSEDVLGVLPVGNGGTGLESYTIGDLLYASAAAVLSKLAAVATGNALISGGVGTAPSWGKIGLTTHVSGDLPFANLVQSSAVSKLVGRGSAAGAGDFEEITLGTNLSMSGTTVNATGGVNMAVVATRVVLGI